MNVAELVAENEAFRKALVVAEQERDALKKLYEKLLHDFERMRRHVVGPQRERLAPANQMSILDLLKAINELQKTSADQQNSDANSVAPSPTDATATDASSAGNKPDAKKKKKRKHTPHGRTRQPIVEREVVIEPDERLAPGGDLLLRIGEERHVILERQRAHILRIVVVLPTYKKPTSPLDDPARADEGNVPDVEILRASPLPSVTPRGLLGPLLIASVIVAKYADHIPLHRQERMFARDGTKLARSTMWDSIATVTPFLERIVQAMWADSRANAPWFATDASGILVRAPGRCVRCSFYVVCAARRHILFGAIAGDADGDDVAELLAGFPPGTPMISDASSIYHELYRRSNYVEVGCWCHGRRMFFDALTTEHRAAAVIAIGLIGMLYDAQQASKDVDGVVDGKRRKDLSLPVLSALDAFAAAQQKHIDPDCRLAKAFNYLENQRVGLRRFLEDGRLRLDNNISELELRREVVGRKNWLFCGSESGVQSNVNCVSLIASCALHDIDPLAYLHDVLLLLPTWPEDAMIELSPLRWGTTRMRDDVIATIAERSMLSRSKALAG
jgi:transposase